MSAAMDELAVVEEGESGCSKLEVGGEDGWRG